MAFLCVQPVSPVVSNNSVLYFAHARTNICKHARMPTLNAISGTRWSKSSTGWVQSTSIAQLLPSLSDVGRVAAGWLRLRMGACSQRCNEEHQSHRLHTRKQNAQRSQKNTLWNGCSISTRLSTQVQGDFHVESNEWAVCATDTICLGSTSRNTFTTRTAVLKSDPRAFAKARLELTNLQTLPEPTGQSNTTQKHRDSTLAHTEWSFLGFTAEWRTAENHRETDNELLETNQACPTYQLQHWIELILACKNNTRRAFGTAERSTVPQLHCTTDVKDGVFGHQNVFVTVYVCHYIKRDCRSKHWQTVPPK